MDSRSPRISEHRQAFCRCPCRHSPRQTSALLSRRSTNSCRLNTAAVPKCLKTAAYIVQMHGYHAYGFVWVAHPFPTLRSTSARLRVARAKTLHKRASHQPLQPCQQLLFARICMLGKFIDGACCAEMCQHNIASHLFCSPLTSTRLG